MSAISSNIYPVTCIYAAIEVVADAILNILITNSLYYYTVYI